MEMLLLGMGGCTEFDVVHILTKGRHQVDLCEVELTAERAEKDPKVFTGIHLHFKVSGPDLTEQAVARAVSLSAEKYCSASIMLGAMAKVSPETVAEETVKAVQKGKREVRLPKRMAGGVLINGLNTRSFEALGAGIDPRAECGK